MGATNAQILEELADFRKESGKQREAIISVVNENTKVLTELDKKVAIQNGRVGRLESDGTKIENRMSSIEKLVWKAAGGLAVIIFAVEVISHLYK